MSDTVVRNDLATTLRCAVAALGCWFAAWTYWVAWRTPLAYDEGRWIELGVGMLVVEFLAIHSGTMIGELGAAGPRWRPLLWPVLGAYALMALAIAVGFASWELALVLLALMGSRLWGLWRPLQGMELAFGRRRSLCSAMLYLLLAFATIFLPIGAGGITPELLDQLWPERGDGLWEAEPQRALVMGLAYFLLLGLIELRPPSAFWLMNDGRHGHVRVRIGGRR